MSVRLIAQTNTNVYLTGDELVVELAATPRGFHLTSLVAALGPILNEAPGSGSSTTEPTAPSQDQPTRFSTSRKPSSPSATEALLDVNVTLLEAPGAFFARILLVATGHKHSSYAKLKAGNATEHLRTLRTARPELAPLLEGIDDRLRTTRRVTIRWPTPTTTSPPPPAA